MKRAFIGVTILVVVIVSASGADDIDKVLEKSARYGDYTKDTYDKKKACHMIVSYLEKHKAEMSPQEKCKLYAHLGSLNSMWARSRQKDHAKARAYYEDAIKSLPHKLNQDILTARINLASLLPTRRNRIRETARVCALLAWYQLMDQETFESHVSLYNAENLTERQYRASIRQLQGVLSTQIRVNSRNLISMVGNMQNPPERLEKLAETFAPGAMAQKELHGRSAQSVANGEGKKKNGLSGPGDIDKATHFLWSVKSRFPNVADREMDQVFNMLAEKDVVPDTKHDLRICDLAYDATELLLYGDRASLVRLSKLSKAERDVLVRKRQKWWENNRAKEWGDVFRHFIDKALEKMAKQDRDISAPGVLRHLLGYDLGYRNRIDKGDSQKIAARKCRQVWERVKDRPWRKWKKLLAKRAQQNERERAQYMEDAEKRALAHRKQIQKLKEERPQLLKFSEEKWPQWQNTERGRKKALEWLRENRKLWADTIAEPEFRGLERRLSAEVEEKNDQSDWVR